MVFVAGACSSAESPEAEKGEAEGPAAVELDTAFGSNGIAETAISGEADRFVSVASGPDGKSYGAGFTTTGGDQAMAVARINEDGSPDTSFDDDGIATVNVAVGGESGERASGMAVQSSGKVVLAGPVEHDPAAEGPAASDTDIAAVRLNEDGSPDASFGEDGVARLDLSTGMAVDDSFLGDTMYGVTLLGSDKLLLVAARLAESGPHRDFAIVRLNADGTPDPTFGEAGVLTRDIDGGSESPRQAVVLEDGGVVVSGYTNNAEDVVSPVLIKIDEEGELDDTFGVAGIATATLLPAVAEAYEVGLQGDSFIITGYGRATEDEKVDLIAARFTADGEWDKTFGEEGLVRVDIAGEDDRGRDLVVLPDNRILIAGSGKPAEADQNGMLVLLEEDGSLADDFGEGGKLQLELGGQTDSVFALTLSEDEKHILVGGWTGPDLVQGGNEDSLFVRLTLE